MNLICLMDLILFLLYKIVLNTSLTKHKTITNNLPVQIYVNKIENRIFLKIKAGFKLESLSKETIKLLGSTKKITIKIRMEKMHQNYNQLKEF